MTTTFTTSPSTITLTDTGLVKRVIVTVNGISSNISQDIKLLLTHNQKSCLLMASQGGPASCSNIYLVFDDFEYYFLTNNPLTNGRYKPTADYNSIISGIITPVIKAPKSA
jgi:hypothetical protein